VRTRWTWVVGAVAVVLAPALAVTFFIDEPLRRVTEREMNARLDGYTARIGRLDFHPIGFSVDFYDVVVVQDAHPDPPVLRVPRLSASVQWTALIRGGVVADFELDRPQVYVDRTPFARELKDRKPVTERGWQDALQAMYPLKINEFKVHGGQVTYVDSAQARPLTLRAIEAVLRDIRNVRSAPDVYPSPIHVEALVFDEGRLSIDGRADFLRVPHLGVKGYIALRQVALDDFRPIAARYGVTLAAGTFGGSGNVEYAPEVTVVDLEEVHVNGLRADYAYRKAAAAPAERAAAKTAETAKEVANKPDVLLKARRIRADGATVGFVNEEARPRYRVFLADTSLVIDNFTNHLIEGTATARLTGRFMGSGATAVTATFRPERDGPDFEFDVRLEETDMKTMNDLLRAHAGVDVVSGVFSVFSETRVKAGWIQGYVKPLFRDLNAYDPEQDEDKSFGQKLKEKAADLLGKVLRNEPREEVATVVPIKGRVENPDAGTWQTLVGLVQNAFFRAILPGFERERSRALRR
jgi:hypothetical protein